MKVYLRLSIFYSYLEGGDDEGDEGAEGDGRGVDEDLSTFIYIYLYLEGGDDEGDEVDEGAEGLMKIYLPFLLLPIQPGLVIIFS